MDTSFAVLEGVSTLASGREAAPDVARYLQSPQLAELAKCLEQPPPDAATDAEDETAGEARRRNRAGTGGGLTRCPFNVT